MTRMNPATSAPVEEPDPAAPDPECPACENTAYTIDGEPCPICQEPLMSHIGPQTGLVRMRSANGGHGWIASADVAAFEQDGWTSLSDVVSMDHVLEQTERPKGWSSEWRDAVLDELVAAHIYSPKYEDDPKLAVHDVIARNVAVERTRLALAEGEKGWIVGSGDGKRWRTWKDGWSDWTDDRDQAVRYARREDAEAVHAEDEDAWTIQPYAHPDPLAAGASAREVHEALEREVAKWEYASRNSRTDNGRRMSLPVSMVCQALAALSAPSQVGEGAKAVGWLRKWSNGQPSEGLVKRQNLSERDIEMMCVALAAAADTIEQRLSAAPVQAGEEGK